MSAGGLTPGTEAPPDYGMRAARRSVRGTSRAPTGSELERSRRWATRRPDATLRNLTGCP